MLEHEGYGVSWRKANPTSFLLNLEGYGDVRSELGDMRVSSQRGKLSMKASLEKRILKSEND